MSVKALIEKRATLWNEAQEILKKETLTAEERAKFDKIMKDVNEVSGDIERRQKAAEVENALKSADFNDGKVNDTQAKKPETRSKEEQREFEARAFYKYAIKGGLNALDAEERKLIERRDLSTNTGSAGDLIPPYFQRDLEVALKYYCPFFNFAEVVDTPDGAPMTWPVMTDVSNTATIVAEGATISDTDMSVSNKSFGAYKFGSLVKVSLEITQDSFTSIDSIVTDAFAIRFGRGFESYFTTGTGSSQPTGILTAATQGALAQGDDNAVSPDGTTALGYIDYLTLFHSVDPAYRNMPGAGWLLNDSTLLAAQSLKDKYGRPLWQPSMSSDVPNQILGKPYFINQSMPNIGASTKPVIFGDLSRYKVRRVKNMTIQKLVERYADAGQVGLIAWARYDANLVDAGTHPVKYILCPLS
jgi:HK97 family phage major capsid protein